MKGGRPHRPRVRRALSNIGGPVETRGDPAVAPALATAFGGELSADDARQHVHGFHSYPARLHPTVARRAVELFAPLAGTVLDPFCGSGTVLVEARLAGRAAWGSDINPVGLRLAQLKCRGATPGELDRLLRAARAVARHADQRRIDRAGASRRYPDEDIRLFDPHVLLELDGLREGIERGPSGFVRDALWLVLSSILTKLSRRAGDTGAIDDRPRRLAAGFPARLFLRKTTELCERIMAFASRLPAAPPPLRVELADARDLAVFDDQSVDLVVSSPPYPGNYDYLDHHRTRARWLGLDDRTLATNELGARRHVDPKHPESAVETFARDLTAVLASLRRILRPGGLAVVVVADSVVGRSPVRAEPLVLSAAGNAQLAWVATASQPRPHFHRESSHAFSRRSPRHEHAILLRRHDDHRG